VCTYIKREVINKVGLLDEETFKGYGAEDADYSKRVKLAGYKLAVAPQIKVTHGVDRKGTETFMRNVGGYYEDIQEQVDANEAAYFKKWGERIRQ
jgi:GT2 family glycosyltransferase